MKDSRFMVMHMSNMAFETLFENHSTEEFIFEVFTNETD